MRINKKSQVAKLLLLIGLLLVNALHVLGQIADENKVHSMFLYNFTKYIEWSNHEDISEFEIAVLGNDTPTIDALIWMSNTKTAKGKKINVVKYGSIEAIENPQMLYVDKKFNYSIEKVLSAIRGKNILLVSHDYKFNVSMINFIIVDGKLKYEVSENRITNEGFTIMPELIALSVKSVSDWKDLYFQTGIMLESEKNKVEFQNDKINKQRQSIENQQQEIGVLNEKIGSQRAKFDDLVSQTQTQEVELSTKSLILSDQQDQIDNQKKEVLNHQRAVEGQRQILMEQESKILRQNGRIEKQTATLDNQVSKIEGQRLVLYFFIVILVLVLFMIFQVYRGYATKIKTNVKLREKNKSIVEQHKLIETKNNEIVDSIRYARLIQNAILPNVSEIEEHLPEVFIMYKPKDIVSGDFYWYTYKDKRSIIAACDCTGHGVPGGFVSMIGNDILNQIVIEKDIADPAQILKGLHDGVVYALDQRSNGTPNLYSATVHDGMDIALCSIDMEKGELQFSGAARPLWFVTKNGSKFSKENKTLNQGEYNLAQIKGDRQGIGGMHANVELSFTTRKIKLQKGDTFYISSDGYTDQFGGKGKRDRPFSRKRLFKLLLSIQHLSMDEQGKRMSEEIEAWRDKYEQTDDICLIGIRI